MGIRSLSTASISTGTKRSKIWDQSAVVLTGAYESIATANVGSGGATTIAFTSIPTTYKHLQIRGIARTNRGGAVLENISMVFNSSTFSGNNDYSFHAIDGDGATASSFSSGGTFQRQIPALISSTNAPANVFGSFVIDVLDYGNTSKNKTVRSLTGTDVNGTGGSMRLVSGGYYSTSSVSTITLGFTVGGTGFEQYSSIALYGIKG